MSSPSPSSSEPTWAGFVLATFAALLPFQAFGPFRVDQVIRFEASDWVLALGSPWLARELWVSRKRVAASNVVRAFVLFSVSGTLSLTAPHVGTLVELARVWAPCIVVASLVALEKSALERVIRAAVRGGAVALAISLCGYVLTAFNVLPTVQDELLFAFRSRHPVFDQQLRLAGTFGFDCQHMGEYALIWMACSSVQSTTRRGAFVALIVGGGAVLLTLSSVMMGLPLVATACAQRLTDLRSRWAWPLALSATLGLAIAASWFMNVGQPEEALAPGSGVVKGDCRQMDLEHFVTHVASRDRARCEQLLDQLPYPSRKTTYRHAKEIAWASFLRAPTLGIGSGQFRYEAQADVVQRFGRSGAVSFYQSPHSQYLGTLAERGVVGCAALLILLWTLRRAACKPFGERASPMAVAGFAFVLIGINADLLHERYVWLLAGVVASTACFRTSSRCIR